MTDGQKFFNNQMAYDNNDQMTYDNIRKIVAGQGNDYIAGCLLDYLDFKAYCKLIAIDLSK